MLLVKKPTLGNWYIKNPPKVTLFYTSKIHVRLQKYQYLILNLIPPALAGSYATDGRTNTREKTASNLNLEEQFTHHTQINPKLAGTIFIATHLPLSGVKSLVVDA